MNSDSVVLLHILGLTKQYKKACAYHLKHVLISNQYHSILEQERNTLSEREIDFSVFSCKKSKQPTSFIFPSRSYAHSSCDSYLQCSASCNTLLSRPLSSLLTLLCPHILHAVFLVTKCILIGLSVLCSWI